MKDNHNDNITLSKCLMLIMVRNIHLLANALGNNLKRKHYCDNIQSSGYVSILRVHCC